MRLCSFLVLPVALCLGLVPVFSFAADLLPPETPIEQAIDHYVDARLQEVGVSAASRTGDLALLRRTMLDLAGRIPTPAEAQSYLASEDVAKRQAMVDGLLASPTFVRQQAAEFDSLLMDGTRKSIREYLLKAFGENRPWDQMVRDLVVGEADDAKQQGAIRFVAARVNDQDRLATDVSSLLFGVNVSCAKCHDHPLVLNWTQDHYYGMLSFFSRTYEVGDYFGEREYGRVSYKTVGGESRNARLMYLTGQPIDEPNAAEPDDAAKKAEKERIEELKKNKEPPQPPSYSRRTVLVDAALADEQANFLPRAIVNHLWNRLLGRGLVHPVDQMHEENRPSHPELLAWLARDLKTNGYDLKRLVRGIVLSETYARTSLWDSASSRPADDLFAVAQVRPLKPWQYGTLLKQATNNPDQFPADQPADQFEQRIEQLQNAGRSLGSLFETPHDDFQVGVDEALLFANGERIAKELLDDGGDSLLAKLEKLPDEQAVVEAAAWSILSRPATADEQSLLSEFLRTRSDRAADARRHLVWALLTSSECRFNH
jgi:hypothetical protein